MVVGLGSVGLLLTKFPFGEEDNVLLGPTSKNRWGYAASKIVDEFMGLAVHPGAPGNVYNVGGTQEVWIRELAERVKGKTGSDSEICYVLYEQAYTTTAPR